MSSARDFNCPRLLQRPDPRILERTVTVPGVLAGEEAEITVRALFAVIVEPALAHLVDVDGEIVILHHEDELVRRAVRQVERVRELDVGWGILEPAELVHLDRPGGQTRQAQVIELVLFAIQKVLLRTEDDTADHDTRGLPGHIRFEDEVAGGQVSVNIRNLVVRSCHADLERLGLLPQQESVLVGDVGVAEQFLQFAQRVRGGLGGADRGSSGGIRRRCGRQRRGGIRRHRSVGRFRGAGRFDRRGSRLRGWLRGSPSASQGGDHQYQQGKERKTSHWNPPRLKISFPPVQRAG